MRTTLDLPDGLVEEARRLLGFKSKTDTVVLCSRGAADRGLYRALRGQVPALHAIGDCWAPRQIEQAIFEGGRVARNI